MIKNVKFETSAFNKKNILKTDKKQIVLVGKSNVGKSTFINAICNNSKLAKVGSAPGKTRSINYYNVDNSFYLVDLPGYGYSKMSLKEKENIANMIDSYLESENIAYIFMLVDIRHTPTEDDKLMYNYLKSYNIPFSIIANKCDKISSSKVEISLTNIVEALSLNILPIAFSGEKKIGITEVTEIIENVGRK